jgi:hypothetical protein
MNSLLTLLVCYISTCLLWSLLLIYYLNRAIISQRQPSWLKLNMINGESSAIILFTSIIISPLLLPLAIILLIKKIIHGENK